MQCPLCAKEMQIICTNIKKNVPGVEDRTQITHHCNQGTNLCDGLLIKHDVIDKKITYVTPAHTCTTLHEDYVLSLSSSDLIKSILTVFEWDYYNQLNRKRSGGTISL